MRALAVVLAGSLIASGCAAHSYRIPLDELERLTHVPPEARGARVRVIQDIVSSDAPAAQPVTRETQIVFEPQVDIAVGVHGHGYAGGGSGFHGGGGKIGGLGSDSKGAAIAFLFLAATALITAAAIEGSRFDGWAQLHPMHPVHLLGRDGGYAVVPLAWLDRAAAEWTEVAVVRPGEGPWLELERAPLSRAGLAYGMYGGTGSLRSAAGDLAMGPAWTVQLGFFPSQELGAFASVFFGWRNNQLDATLFETRYTAELQYLPVHAGLFHAGLYGGGGLAYRFEDAVKVAGGQIVTGDESSGAVLGGAMFQLDIHTRIALTARLGITWAHGEQMRDALFGVSVY
jgi:hypothetical protein